MGPFPLVRLELRTCLFSPTIVSDPGSLSVADYAARDCFAALHSLAKSPFVKTSGDRRNSAFLRRVGPLSRCPNPKYQKLTPDKSGGEFLVAAKDSLGINAYAATVTISLRYTCEIYLLSDQGPHLSRLNQNKKRPQGSFVILVAAKGFGPLTKGL